MRILPLALVLNNTGNMVNSNENNNSVDNINTKVNDQL